MDFDRPLYEPLNSQREEGEEHGATHCIEANLFAVKSVAGCPECGQPNVVVTLGFTPEPDSLPCDEFKFFTLFGITEMPASVVKALKKINPNYCLYSHRISNEERYFNACADCGCVFEDNDLSKEPSDAFLPLITADYECIQLIDLRRQTNYQLMQDDDETRFFEEIKANNVNPAPDLWQVIVEQQDL